ncbi:hypothetical protein [Chengkuizengella marina]|uniref:Uncharacterized protein n=1 Tax=Chengkuizengella marina TaxID=2507566 RepID=A0A6N9Q8M2_9BACL|nr:hypothetical protein [Chengkuizengella marina]NBI31217.1 hypothetical protein [Chengkuizengella marina]
MGIFDKTKCDCCVCPMQCVLKELEGETVDISTTTNVLNSVTINEVKDFNLFSSEGIIPISQITSASILPPIQVKLKPIRISKGECSCCEDPITKLLSTLIGKVVEIGIEPNFIVFGTVSEVGQGNVNIENVAYVSTCSIIKVRCSFF